MVQEAVRPFCEGFDKPRPKMRPQFGRRQKTLRMGPKNGEVSLPLGIKVEHDYDCHARSQNSRDKRTEMFGAVCVKSYLEVNWPLLNGLPGTSSLLKMMLLRTE